MKKLIVLLMCLALFGCAGIEFQDDQTQQVIVKSAARIFAYKVILQNDTMAGPVKALAVVLSDGKLDDAMVVLIRDALILKFPNDVIIVESFMDVIKLVKIKETGAYNPELVRVAAIGVIEGVALAEAQNKK